jgi:AICAR transformylase/IMP cyclohydrolase PurH
MEEYILKYGLNPSQKPARVYSESGLPFEILSGRPGAINLMDALNGWQLVREMKQIANRPAAASFKHVSPAGAAVSDKNLPIEKSAIANAYRRAREADPMSSFGDFVSLSDKCDEATAKLISREVSDGVIAPEYTPAALEILRRKRDGTYVVLKIDPDYEPEPVETRRIFGVSFEQGRNNIVPNESLLKNIATKNFGFSDSAKEDMLLSMSILKFTQSNSVCLVKDGMAIGIGAGQQSRIHCTRLACDKADRWWLRRHPKLALLPFLPSVKRPDRNNVIDIYLNGEPFDTSLFEHTPEEFTPDERAAWLAQNTGATLGSDAFFPFSDNIERAAKSGVSYVVQPGGSKRDDAVIEACDSHGMVMAMTGVRLFHH